jgi:hypothetical protein
LDESIGSLLRPFKDWATDLATRKSEPRSTKELREVLYGIAKAESDELVAGEKNAAASAPHGPKIRQIIERADIRMRSIREKIDQFDKATLLAVIDASSYPNYNTYQSIRESVTAAGDIRSTALFFGTLDRSNLSRNCYFIATHHLAQMDSREDVFRLHRSNPEAANSLLLLIAHFLSDGTGVGAIHPEIKSMVMENPDIVHDMITFARQRDLDCLNDLHPELFLAAMETSYRPLRDGVL